MNAPARRLVIGVGNAMRRDDAAGLALIERLGALAPPGLTLRTSDGEMARLLELWEGHDDVVLVDAATGAGPPGRVIVLDGTRPLPSGLCRSTHAFGVAEALALARALGRLPRRVTVLGVVGAEFGFGAALSAPVRAAVERLAVDLAEASWAPRATRVRSGAAPGGPVDAGPSAGNNA